MFADQQNKTLEESPLNDPRLSDIPRKRITYIEPQKENLNLRPK